MSIKDLVLKKGWAGKTLSRQETVGRINPIIRTLVILMHRYDGSNLPQDPTWHHAFSILRMDIGKLSEIVNSNGGKAYIGTDIEPGYFGDVDSIVLREEEEAFTDLLAGEKIFDHQMRTRAILDAVSLNSDARQLLLAN